MHLDVYVEEPSAKAALEILVPRIVGEPHTFRVLSFGNKQHLLREIPKRLKGYSHWLPRDWRIVVLVDEDRQDCHVLKAHLVEAARQTGLADRVLSRIAVEELEAWFFGDVEALRAVYPRIPKTLARRRRFRNPDAVAGGTWEVLDQVLQRSGYPAGLSKIESLSHRHPYGPVAQHVPQLSGIPRWISASGSISGAAGELNRNTPDRDCTEPHPIDQGVAPLERPQREAERTAGWAPTAEPPAHRQAPSEPSRAT
jgi:hypothetical protein